ncbi:hypothetical protein HOI26_01410 [Candidatus Woesearchaeota archaeon]|mgnify:CR=1 FL=1|jgi:hypothetical protein|nr:hypothetical protein [Candidatus Woesearchaeota archaeon]MBT5739733.1 hypothetical protein [Candidatus Woesearchaeota archaeon]
MNKRGVSLITVTALKVLLVVAVSFFVINTVIEFTAKDKAFKETAVEDLRMQINVLIATSGDSVIKYPYNLSEYNLALSDKSITLFEHGEPEDSRLRRRFSLPEGYTATGLVVRESDVCLKKESNDITLEVCNG